MPGHIPWKQVELRLRCNRTIWISTTRPDGRPHSVPVWFWWDGRYIYFPAAKDSQKMQNLAHQAWTVVHLSDGENAVLMIGEAALVTDIDEREKVDTSYREKYVDPLTGTPATVLDPHNLLYRVAIKNATAWMSSNAATRTDWQFDN
jgi:nitroimidazol reductase NimA-like FMN-containing flavoprotein (pyridoxamine 5'-phosphate oxidase superfamily)